jgi:4,5-DOPA dioxygenase extradiol
MNRRKAIITLASGVSALGALSLLRKMPMFENQLKLAPIIFIGHGSPMNALANNPFTLSLNKLKNLYPNPTAIVCISAHWMTKGTWVTHMEKPKTIHDFGGFPQKLFDVQYPAPGSPKTAELISKMVKSTKINLDDSNWGLDHGTWTVLKHVFPEANIPIIQLSLDLSEPPEYHLKLGQELFELRKKGVLIIGSGNIVHNLRTIKWEDDAKPFDWAIEFDEKVKLDLEKRDIKSLVSTFSNTHAGKLSVPTPDHYYPLLYILGAMDKNDDLQFHYDGIELGSISMRTFSFGKGV